MHQTSDRETLTPEESRDITGFGRSITYQMLRDGTLPHIKVGRRFFVPRSALMRWLDTCGIRSTTPE